MPVNHDQISPFLLPPAHADEVTLRWHLTDIECALLGAIATRGAKVAILRGAVPAEMDIMGLMMDVGAVHCNDKRLDLHALLQSDDLTFFEELVNIKLHLERSTGKLRGGFTPKFQAKT